MALGEKSYFWDKPDKVLTEEELAYYKYSGQDLASVYESMYTTGVTPQFAVSSQNANPSSYIGSSLAVSAGNGLQVVVSPGTAMIKGRPYLLSLPLTFNIVSGAITDIVLQSNSQQERPEIKLVARTRPTGTGLIENIKHESLVYEIVIASIDVPTASIQINPTMIIDQRLNMSIHPVDSKPISGLCQSIPQVNTLGIWEDYQKLDTYIKAVWRTFITESTDEWATFLTNKRNDFDTWFATIQGVLEGDIAVNLANQIAELQNSKANKTDTYTKTEVDTAFATKAPTTHNHDASYIHSGRTSITQAVFDDISYPYSYLGIANALVGLPTADWYHIIYIPHVGAGYGTQILTSFHGTGRMYVRSAHSTGWGTWTIVYTSENITCSTSRPSSFMGNGHIHHVF